MSFSNTDASPQAGEYKYFRQITRDRLLNEMIQASKSGDSRSSGKVLIMDKVTVKVMSNSCKMSDISDQGVPLVEGLFKRRQPLPSSDAIYFIQPSKENIIMFLSDMSGREPLYRKAFVFFSSPVTKDLVTRIKNDSSVLPRIGALKEINLEYFIIDKQGFMTDQERSLEELFGGDGENSRRFDACLNVMAKRVATVFASLKEFPFVRYRAAKGIDGTTITTYHDIVSTKLAAAVWNNIMTYKSSISDFPQTETCELLIVDRSVDQIAPIIHEWTYDAMCHDLLNLDGNKYMHEVPSKSGGHPEIKEVVLEDHDPIWLELRHSHIAEASERLHDKMKNFVAKNKAAQLQQRDGNELSTRDLSKLVQALPQYSEQMERLSLHIEIADKLNKIIRNVGLQEIGQLEQDLVFGDAEPEEVRKFLTRNQEGLSENKLRLLMIYAAVYPEKFEGDKAFKLMQLARLSDGDMKAVKNMRLIEGSDSRKASETFSLKFVSDKGKSAIRKDRTREEQTWTLFRFYPIIEELIEKLSKGGLPKDEYHCMNNPSPLTKREAASVRAGQSVVPLSMRSRRTPTWARSCSSTDSCSSDASMRSGFKKMGPRIFIFIIGGATRSELRVCHKLTEKLGREVVLGTTSIDDPHQYITKLKLLSEKELLTDE